MATDVLALAAYLVFAGVGFGVRTWVQWRRTGDTGLRIEAAPGSVQWWAKLGFLAALLAGLAAPVAGILGLERLEALDRPALRALGTVLAVAGIVATVVAQWQMGSSWRIGVDPGERTELVTAGAFGAVRNPIFSAMLLVAAGMALMVGNVVGVVGLVALVVALQVHVRLVEEPYLRRTHGAAYEGYAAVAGRFLPGIGRLRPR